MPSYDYYCQKCERAFEVRKPLAEYSATDKPACPKCGSRDVIRTFSPLHVMSSRSRGSAPPGCCGPSSGPGCCG